MRLLRSVVVSVTSSSSVIKTTQHFKHIIVVVGFHLIPIIRGIASSKYVRGPQLNN